MKFLARLDAAKGAMDVSAERYRLALEAILTETVRLVSKELPYRGQNVIAACADGELWIAVDGYPEFACKGDTVDECAEIFLTSRAVYGPIVLPTFRVQALNGVVSGKMNRARDDRNAHWVGV